MSTQLLRLLTYNLQMLPGPFGDGRADLERAEQFVARVLATKPGFDILCLQEVFDEDVREYLAKSLKRRFRHQVSKSSDSDIFHEDSGLFFASRYPVVGSRFVEFEAAAGTDSLADKGVFGARLDVSDTTVLVFNTHLQASVKHGAVRVRQSRQIRKFVRRTLLPLHEAERNGVVAIACGDFNVVAEHAPVAEAPIGFPTDEYSAFIGWLGWPRDLFREAHPADPGFTWDGSRNTRVPAKDKDRQRLDYVFTWDEIPTENDIEPPRPLCPATVHEVAVERFETETLNDCLSDHFGVRATVGFDA